MTRPNTNSRKHHFFPESITSPFLHAMILILEACTISFPSILNDGFLTTNVQTSSQNRYVCRCPYCTMPVAHESYEHNRRQTTAHLEVRLRLHLLDHRIR